MPQESFTITPAGPFSVAEAATFGFGQRAGGAWDGVMRLAFCLDGYERQVGAEVRQDQAGTVSGLVHGAAPAGLGLVRDQVALAGRLYQLGAPPSEAAFRALAQPWKPFRTWAAVLIRAAAARVLGGGRRAGGGTGRRSLA